VPKFVVVAFKVAEIVFATLEVRFVVKLFVDQIKFVLVPAYRELIVEPDIVNYITSIVPEFRKHWAKSMSFTFFEVCFR
jgi:hypothetical protein